MIELDKRTSTVDRLEILSAEEGDNSMVKLHLNTQLEETDLPSFTGLGESLASLHTALVNSAYEISDQGKPAPNSVAIQIRQEHDQYRYTLSFEKKKLSLVADVKGVPKLSFVGEEVKLYWKAVGIVDNKNLVSLARMIGCELALTCEPVQAELPFEDDTANVVSMTG